MDADYFVEWVIKFRELVPREFERFVRECVPLPEMPEAGRNRVEGA